MNSFANAALLLMLSEDECTIGNVMVMCAFRLLCETVMKPLRGSHGFVVTIYNTTTSEAPGVF